MSQLIIPPSTFLLKQHQVVVAENDFYTSHDECNYIMSKINQFIARLIDHYSTRSHIYKLETAHSNIIISKDGTEQLTIPLIIFINQLTLEHPDSELIRNICKFQDHMISVMTDMLNDQLQILYACRRIYHGHRNPQDLPRDTETVAIKQRTVEQRKQSIKTIMAVFNRLQRLFLFNNKKNEINDIYDKDVILSCYK